MDVELLSRLQFAVTVAFHFIFPPITIGLGTMLCVIEWLGWKRDDEHYKLLGRFFSKILAITFAVGVASGLVMVLQFGTNWSRYSAFVGDIFGAPLAAEAIFAFFLESTFLGLYLFGRNKVSPGVHWFSILMVTVGSVISAFWILVANSWQQTPAGFAIQNIATGQIIETSSLMTGYDPTMYRAVLTDFWEAVFNPSTIFRFAHTIFASWITGAFIVAGVSAYFLLKKKYEQIAMKGIKLSLIYGFIFSLLQLFPVGHEHARDVYKYQPSKFAAIQGLYTTEKGVPLVLFGWVSDDIPPQLKAKVGIPGILSFLVTGKFDAELQGLDKIPSENRPPLWLTFVSYHNMVLLGGLFILIPLIGLFKLKRKKIGESRKFLKILFWFIPLPIIACQFGWVAAEVGRQPWIVYGLLRTSDAFSLTVPAGQVWFTFILFTIFYVIMTIIYIWLLIRELKKGITSEQIPLQGKEVLA
ncbi:MAG: cytochrome ubiquinol oxidase subunit I [Ignavibacteria bacterium]